MKDRGATGEWTRHWSWITENHHFVHLIGSELAFCSCEVLGIIPRLCPQLCDLGMSVSFCVQFSEDIVQE